MEDRFSNSLTYADKWKTEENKEKVEKLLRKYKSIAWSDCPCSWVDEVTALLTTIKKKYPHIKIEQFKEKFGTLRVYFAKAKNDKEEIKISKLIDECQTKLVRKLSYPYPIYQCQSCKEESIYYTENKKKQRRCSHCKDGKLKKVKLDTN